MFLLFYYIEKRRKAQPENGKSCRTHASCRGGDSRARRCTCARNRLSIKWQTFGVHRLIGSLHWPSVPCRERHAAPLQWQVHASGAAPNLRAVHGASGTPHPTTRHRYFNNTPQKCSLSFLRLHFFIGRIGENARFRRAFSAPAAGAARAGKCRLLRAELA